MNLSNSQKERPRERLRDKGVAYLGDVELIEILLGTGTRAKNCHQLANELLQRVGGIAGLSKQGLGSLCKQVGMGTAKAARVIAAVELGARIIEKQNMHKAMGRFSCSQDIYLRYSMRLSRLRQEIFLVVGLNNKNEVITEAVVAMGTVDECRVNPRDVFRPLIAEAAARMIALHNHPSGDPTPSPEDIALTDRLVSAGKLVGISVLDHLVIGNDTYCSLRDMGAMIG